MNIKELNEKGWFQTRISNADDLFDVLIEYANELGNPIKGRKSSGIVQKLVPVSKESAYPNSLSYKYETEAFPLHVDTAHWIKPCRYLILGCMDEGASMRPTTLLDFNSLEITKEEKDELYNAPFIIRNGRSSFYGNILAKNREFIRYDSGCMISANNSSSQIADLFSSERVRKLLTEVFWEKGMVLVIDNWRILHGRGKPMKNGRDRELYRVLVS